MSIDRQLYVAVDWAPAWELVLSLLTYVCFPKHSLLELGEPWARDIRRRLPPDLAPRLLRKNAIGALNLKENDLLMLLVRVCPGKRDTAGFLEWLADLSSGDAYEAVAPLLPDSGPRLPRDFLNWRDRCLQVLNVWNEVYFHAIDPSILDLLDAAADILQMRLMQMQVQLDCSPQELIEETTNGILVEPTAEPLQVTLVPQYHQRPYNTDVTEQGGIVILYPADILPPAADRPPPRLLRLTHALSDESRLRMLRYLADGPRTLTEVARFIGLSQPTVHHHLVQLRAAGLVRVHFVVSTPSRYSLRPHALEQLSDQLGEYLQALAPLERRPRP
jgi:DNA-binding transcriptional ArsR family regulator